jgi:hypothetical protein
VRSHCEVPTALTDCRGDVPTAYSQIGPGLPGTLPLPVLLF